MYRSRFVKPTSYTLLMVTAIYAVSAACGSGTTGPCKVEESQEASLGFIDGVWRATTINNQPAANYPIQAPSTDRLISGIIVFDAEKATPVSDVGGCDKIFKTEGVAIANYGLRQQNGTVKPPERYVGRFTYYHKDQTLQLTGGEYTVDGTVAGATMTLSGENPKFGTAVVVLRKD